MFIEGVVDVDEEGQLPGKKYSYQGRGRSQTKIRLTKETILLGKFKRPRSRYANRTAYLIFGRTLCARVNPNRNKHIVIDPLPSHGPHDQYRIVR